MEKQFLTALETVYKHEGVFSNDIDDAGGKTKYGITEIVWVNFHNGNPPYSIREITREDAQTIYYELYWKKMKLNQLPALQQTLLTQILDSGINHGVGTGIKFLQRAYNLIKLDTEAALLDDGVVGPKTISAILKIANRYPDSLIAAYIGERYLYYRAIITSNPSQKKFIRGWIKRILV